jgi:gamma-glutamyltranspeptidase/glutathione hydrolase
MKQFAARAIAVVLSLAVLSSFVRADSLHDVVAEHGVVVTVEANASDVGLAVLKRGGNAVDAAVATAFALAVTHPQAGNIGGGGFMMVHLAKTGETECVEYREAAPGVSTPETFTKLTATSRGHLSVGVPGTVRGLALAHEKFGSRPWQELVAPAVRLAEDGFEIDAHLARSLNGWLRAAKDYDEVQRVFRKPDGAAWQPGDRLVQPDLARTLRLIAERGPDAFYTGPIADQIVAEMQAGGGIVTKDDLAAYRANVRRPIHGTYRGHDIYAPPPPSSGGIALVEMLNILEQFNLAGQGRDSAATVHQMTEAMRRAYFDRARHVGDPAFTAVPTERLTSKAYAKGLATAIVADRAARSDELGREVLTATEGESTTHFSIVDTGGNAVSNTYTLQDSYGSYVVVRGAGFLLNNEMTDFNLQPGITDRGGRIGTPPNVVAPHKRMLSSQTPTIVLRDGKVLLVTGTPGGRTIINTVLGVVTNVIDYKILIRDAVDAPRMHHQWMPDVLRVEPGRVSDETRRELEAMGHKIESMARQGDAHSILIDLDTGLRHGAADRRLSGKAAGY